jgi:hypothetical protein
MIRHRLSPALLTIAISLGCGARESADEPDREESPSTESTAAEATVPVVETELPAAGDRSSLADTFDVDLPRGRRWLIVNEGAFGDVKDTFLLAVMDPERQIQLSVSVAPLPPRVQTLDAMKAFWEISFLKNATRKTSSEDIRIGRRDAFKITAALDGPDETRFEMVGILVVAGGRSYTLGVTKPGTNACDDPEVNAFINSFRIMDGQD